MTFQKQKPTRERLLMICYKEVLVTIGCCWAKEEILARVPQETISSAESPGMTNF